MEIISKLWVFVSYCAETALGFMCAVNKTDKSEERQNKKKPYPTIFSAVKDTLCQIDPLNSPNPPKHTQHKIGRAHV